MNDMYEREDNDPSDVLRYATDYHAPVLCNTVVEGLVTNLAGLYVDATLGGGGHSAALLDALDEDGRVIGIDQDAEALAEARSRLGDRFKNRFRAVAGNFGYLDRVLDELGIDQVDGILMDLGVSSHQIDSEARGFSYATSGPLDMRMNPHAGSKAVDIVNHWTTSQLTHMFRNYGEERRAPKIAQRITRTRPLKTTSDLANVVRACVPPKEVIKTLSRVFQALRIAVNDELTMLEQALPVSLKRLKPGGRLAVLSYHSLEDRITKRFMRYGNFAGEPVHDFYGNLLTPWTLITRKPIMASPDEIRANPRARSARLRIAEKATPLPH